jgi:hypothetical protein
MKKVLFIILLAVSIQSFGQAEEKVEQYCRLVASGVVLSKKVTIDVDFGEERKLFSDKRLRDENTGKLKKFNSIIDALNYMGSQGWTLVNAFPQTGTVNSPEYHFYFKKSFNKTDLEKKE